MANNYAWAQIRNSVSEYSSSTASLFEAMRVKNIVTDFFDYHVELIRPLLNYVEDLEERIENGDIAERERLIAELEVIRSGEEFRIYQETQLRLQDAVNSFNIWKVESEKMRKHAVGLMKQYKTAGFAKFTSASDVVAASIFLHENLELVFTLGSSTEGSRVFIIQDWANHLLGIEGFNMRTLYRIKKGVVNPIPEVEAKAFPGFSSSRRPLHS